MKLGESIKKMFDRFTNIVNGFKALGKVYSNKEMVKKLINSPSKYWEAKVTTIEESKNLDELSLDKVMGSLLACEMKLEHGKEKTRQVGVVLNFSIQEESNDDDEEEEKEEDNEEVTILAKKFKRFMKMDKGKRFQERKIIS
ncbi:hypothetical protein J1N35_019190 [Gossypium stocksii]|uniref:UBN2 domain-containing protein n=1 Tax=Gossypium stocksii TaxID=47602 RepID=A0A9D3VS45_9ROSI|nr:hypothetical protein J1N35_019190 [Gossypium stocksii]